MRSPACSRSLAAERERKLAQEILKIWNEAGSSEAHAQLNNHLACLPELWNDAPLLKELRMRLGGYPGPRLLVDGLWFSRPHGGVSRVWEAILSCWSLPDLAHADAPIAIVDRNSHLALSGRFESLDGQAVNPLDPTAVGALASENTAWCTSWNADVFLSSWISTTTGEDSTSSELALVHDCMPERSQPDPALLMQRRRWLKGASGHLAVSAATAQDVEGLLRLPRGQTWWCHPGHESRFEIKPEDPQLERIWIQLKERIDADSGYVLLPATSRVGSYKNPELVAQALSDPRLHNVQLVICGVAASQRAEELIEFEQSLKGRCISASFTELELALAYHHALAVVIPSRIEGFGLPAIEAMASRGRVIVADSRGLREAGSEAALRCHPEDPRSLAALVLLLKDEPSSTWLKLLLEQRCKQRLKRLTPDLLGLALLAQARQIAERKKINA